MKKLLFACVCAATVAAFADSPLNSVGFEDFDAGTTGLGEKTDTGSASAPSGYLFAYEAADDSEDGSIVKAYGVGENLPTFSYAGQWGVPAAFTDVSLPQDNYLELSTEGGTLWRSATETQSPDGTRVLGDGFDMVYEHPTLYVDTMVQFTPTEDGEIPQVKSGEDKIAIWLDVDSTDENNVTTQLCVWAAVVDDNYTFTPTKFTITNAVVRPGEWYRLTVKAIGDVTENDSIPGFMIYLDGNLLKSDTQGLTPQYVEALGLEGDMATDIENGSVFVSLCGSEQEPKFRGVGFKGSGAIDDFQIDTATPNFIGGVSTLDFTLTWGEGISAVSYTINGGEATAATSGTKVEDVPANAEVVVTVTPAPWYVVDTANSSATTFTVAEANQTYTYAATLAATPDAAGATGLTGVTTAAAKTWADAKGLTPAQIADCDYAYNAYLLNTDLTAAPALSIEAIEEAANGWTITVKATAGENTVSLDGINGVLKVKTSATLGALDAAEATVYTATFDAAGIATITVTGDNKNFMKATVTAPAAAE